MKGVGWREGTRERAEVCEHAQTPTHPPTHTHTRTHARARSPQVNGTAWAPPPGNTNTVSGKSGLALRAARHASVHRGRKTSEVKARAYWSFLAVLTFNSDAFLYGVYLSSLTVPQTKEAQSAVCILTAPQATLGFWTDVFSINTSHRTQCGML